MDRDKQAKVQKSEFIQTAKCLATIEKQNLRVVEVLNQVGQTSKSIKLSDDYTQVKINKALGRKGNQDMDNFGPSFMNDDLMEDDMYDMEERAH